MKISTALFKDGKGKGKLLNGHPPIKTPAQDQEIKNIYILLQSVLWYYINIITCKCRNDPHFVSQLKQIQFM